MTRFEQKWSPLRRHATKHFVSTFSFGGQQRIHRRSEFRSYDSAASDDAFSMLASLVPTHNLARTNASRTLVPIIASLEWALRTRFGTGKAYSWDHEVQRMTLVSLRVCPTESVTVTLTVLDLPIVH
jgi:hypothetical protein